MGDPMHVYPDPNGGANSRNFVPSDTRLAAGSIVSGTAAVITAAVSSGTGTTTSMLLFLQEAGRGAAADSGFMAIHAADARHVAIFLFFAALSVLLQVINLVKGFKMKRDLLELSQKVDTVCKNGPPTPTVLDWWATRK